MPHASRSIRTLLGAAAAAAVLAGCETVPTQSEPEPRPVALVDPSAALAVIPLCTPTQLAGRDLELDTSGRFPEGARVFRTERGFCKPPSADSLTAQRALFENAFATEIENGSMHIKDVGRGICLVVDGAGFHPGGAKVAKPLEEILEHVAWVSEHVAADLTVVGHTDDVGSAKVNQKLSESRARTAAGVIKGSLADPTRVRYEGRGEAQPVVANDTREGRARNRRVEILVEPRLTPLG